MTTIKANVSEMFSHREPWDCSNSVANLGPRAGELTWGCAREVADNADKWLLGDVGEACDGMRDWARGTGAWEREEITALTDVDLLALFVQNIASELRDLGCDDDTLEDCVARSGDDENTIGSYTVENGNVLVEYYTGV